MSKVLQFPRPSERAVERRRFQRHALQLRCLVKVGSLKTARQALFLAEIQNGSRGGYFLIARDNPVWEIGAEVECMIQLSGSGERQIGMRFNGKVVRLVNQGNGQVGIGMMLDDLCLPVPTPHKAFERHHLRKPEAQSFQLSMAA